MARILLHVFSIQTIQIKWTSVLVDIIRTSRVQTCFFSFFSSLRLCEDTCAYVDLQMYHFWVRWVAFTGSYLCNPLSPTKQHIPTHVLYHHLVLFMMVLGTNTPSYDAHAGTPNFMVFGGGCGIYGIQWLVQCGEIDTLLQNILMMQMLFFYCLWAARWI